MKIHGDEENSTDRKCFREEIGGERSLQELSGTHLGVLREERSVAPAITVREEECRSAKQGGNAEISVPLGLEIRRFLFRRKWYSCKKTNFSVAGFVPART